MEKQRIEDCDKEQLVKLVKILFNLLEQEYLCLPETKHLTEVDLCFFKPTNALVDILYAEHSPHPSECGYFFNFRKFKIVPREVEDDRISVMPPPEVVQ